MPRRVIDRPDDLQLDLRQGHVQRAQQHAWHRVPRHLRQLGARGLVVPPPPAGSRGVVVKGWLAKASTTGPHLRYLTHGKGTDGADTTLFGSQGFVRDPRDFIRAAQADPHQFRWVVSAVDGDRLQLMRYTQALMRQVERDVQRPLEWLAAIHRDTSHVHTHVVVRGRDRDGRDLYVLPHYLSRGVRYRAMSLATAVLGRVPRAERQRSREATRALDVLMDAQAEEAKRPTEDSMDDPLLTFTRLMEGHDVSFDDSDDAQVRQRGAEERRVIGQVYASMSPTQQRQAREIWNDWIDRLFPDHAASQKADHWPEPVSEHMVSIEEDHARLADQIEVMPGPDVDDGPSGGSHTQPSLLERLTALREAISQRVQQRQATSQGRGLEV
jgi:hypothetical protein